MAKVILRKTKKERRQLRIRAKISGTATTPRLTVFRSNRYIYAQLINDVVGNTLVNTAAEAKELHKGVAKVDASAAVGKLLAKKALEKGIKTVVFDRSG